MRLLLVPALLVTLLVPQTSHAQRSEDRIERIRTERRVARDFGVGAVIAGTLGLLVSGPLVIATATDEPQLEVRGPWVVCEPAPCPPPAVVYASERAQWDAQLTATGIATAASLALVVVGAVVLAIVPSPGEPIPLHARIGLGSLSIEGTF